MQSINLIHEKVRFGADDYLSGVLSYPSVGQPKLAVLVCSPHPNFGGDMENNVVSAVMERMASEAITLRFDYRGVGQSHIELESGISAFDFWENIELTLDYTLPEKDTSAAADELFSASAGLPIIAIGYSFGAVMATWIGTVDERVIAMVGIAPPLKRVGFEHLAKGCKKPCLLICGQDDFVFDAGAADRLLANAGCNLTLSRPEADHFFIDKETELAESISGFTRSIARARAE